MKEETKLNFGFVVILPDHNIGRLQSTINSIEGQYPSISSICVTDDTTSNEDIKEMGKLCPVLKGRNTVTSLINEGMKYSKTDWNILVVGGTFITKGFVKRIFAPVSGANDIMYSVYAEYDKQGRPSFIYNDFSVASLNGVTIHKDTFKKIGDFSDNPMEISKLLWGLDAVNKGCTFKGILGAKII